jgi:hypothetical protein
VSEIKPEDVIWTMTWGPKYPDKPPTEEIFEADKALAVLLAEDVIFLNSNWWEDDWPKKAREQCCLCVNCNDVFAWGCADAESALYDDIEPLYRAWLADPTWGPTKWCIRRRNQKPQGPVEKAMRAVGVWDAEMDAIGENTMDAELHQMIGLPVPKYEKGEYVPPPKKSWWQRLTASGGEKP